MMQCNLFWIKSCILTPKYNIRHRHLTDQHLVFKFFCPSVDQSHGFYRDHQIFWPQSSDFKSFEVERFQLIVVNLQDLICSQGLIKKQFITIINCSNRPYLLDMFCCPVIYSSGICWKKMSACLHEYVQFNKRIILPSLLHWGREQNTQMNKVYLQLISVLTLVKLSLLSGALASGWLLDCT